MLQRVRIDGVELPRLYIAENKQDAELAIANGLPFVRWKQGQDALIRILLRPTLERMFPGILWNKVLGPRRRTDIKIEYCDAQDQDFNGELNADTDLEENEDVEITDVDPDPGCSISTSTRVFSCDEQANLVYDKLSLEEYVGDLSSCVNIEVLQRLKLMPSFIGDILENIRRNVTASVYWNEGYNKKHGACLGNYNRAGQLPNLIILDVSGSIPRSISATMLCLIDTLRTQCNADLIITSSTSRFYPAGSELPSPDELRRYFGYANESTQFFRCLQNNVRGKHYGHVISFGDNDTPEYQKLPPMQGTQVEAVHHYFVKSYCSSQGRFKTGYAKWCHALASEPRQEYNTDWCSVMRKRMED